MSGYPGSGRGYAAPPGDPYPGYGRGRAEPPNDLYRQNPRDPRDPRDLRDPRDPRGERHEPTRTGEAYGRGVPEQRDAYGIPGPGSGYRQPSAPEHPSYGSYSEPYGRGADIPPSGYAPQRPVGHDFREPERYGDRRAPAPDRYPENDRRVMPERDHFVPRTADSSRYLPSYSDEPSYINNNNNSRDTGYGPPGPRYPPERPREFDSRDPDSRRFDSRETAPLRPRDDARDGFREGFRDWPLPADGIAKSVIQKDICLYLGPDATVRGPLKNSSGEMVYYVNAYRALTSAQKLDLQDESARYLRNEGSGRQGNNQPRHDPVRERRVEERRLMEDQILASPQPSDTGTTSTEPNYYAAPGRPGAPDQDPSSRGGY